MLVVAVCVRVVVVCVRVSVLVVMCVCVDGGDQCVWHAHIHVKLFQTYLYKQCIAIHTPCASCPLQTIYEHCILITLRNMFLN